MAKLTEEQRKVLANSVDEVMREVERANRAFEALGVDTQLSALLTDRTGRPVADVFSPNSRPSNALDCWRAVRGDGVCLAVQTTHGIERRVAMVGLNFDPTLHAGQAGVWLAFCKRGTGRKNRC
jgi:hypothetical protein